ncbi:heavy-metal-associated domain-containing protein [Kribbella deserti]|uniref:Heavy-metal-associated domain-containing protein n=1 Tax=Kribbella deserti TaxID=1926257 RepID=A0ABV6QKX3_9ACTN
MIAVEGMTCRNCVALISDELMTLPTVSAISVNLDTGAVEVSADAALDIEDLHQAIRQAGYIPNPTA